MKVFILLFMTLSTSLSAGTPWAHLSDFEDNKELYLVGPVVNNKEIKYCFFIDDQRLDGSLKIQEELSFHIEHALKSWLNSVDQYGVYDKKGAKIDLKNVKIKNIDCSVDQNVNIGFLITSKPFSYTNEETGKKECEYPIGIFYISDENVPVIYINSNYNVMSQVDAKIKKNKIVSNIKSDKYSVIDGRKILTMLYETIIHEAGHAFGLADQYLDNEGDKDFSTDYRDIYSIMFSGPIIKPSCDDVTGLLFLFDRYSKYSRTMNAICSYEKGIYKNGKKEGDWSVYFMNGKIKYKGTYVQGKKEGTFHYYEITTGAEYLTTYKNNEPINGTVLVYTPDDLLQYSGEYKNGKKEGLWSFFDPRFAYMVKGTPVSQFVCQGIYEDGKIKDGEVVEYYDQEGAVKSTRSYRNGKLNGLSHFYNINGELTKDVMYKDDVLKKETVLIDTKVSNLECKI